MNTSYRLIFALALFQTGCSSLPIPVKNDISYLNNITIDTANLPYGDLTSISSSQDSMRKHSQMYREEALRKRKNSQYASETTFYSSIIGVIGGLTKSFTTALTGGVGAAGAGLYSDRYRLEVQAINYESAADAMDCMDIATIDIKSIGNLQSFKIALSNNFEDIQSAELAVLETARNGIMQVRKKLDTLQSRFELGKPDPTRLKEAVTQARGSVINEPMQLGISKTMTLADQASSEKIGEYKSKIDSCVAAFSG